MPSLPIEIKSKKSTIRAHSVASYQITSAKRRQKIAELEEYIQSQIVLAKTATHHKITGWFQLFYLSYLQDLSNM